MAQSPGNQENEARESRHSARANIPACKQNKDNKSVSNNNTKKQQQTVSVLGNRGPGNRAISSAYGNSVLYWASL